MAAHKHHNSSHGSHTSAAQKAKMAKVMEEFKNGTLFSSSGQKVTKRAQAVAIALQEAGLSRRKT